MKKEEMNEIINEELKHIPSSYRGSQQNMFRQHYSSMREHSLKQDTKCPARVTLVETTEVMKKNEPNFSPIYDRQFFHVDS